MHDAMPDRAHRLPALPHSLHDEIHARGVIGRTPGRPDALDLPGEHPPRRIALLEECELEARGAGIHRQDGGHRGGMVPSKREWGQPFTGMERLGFGPRRLFPPISLDPAQSPEFARFPYRRATGDTGMSVAILGDRKAPIPGRIHAMKTMATATVMLWMLGLLGAA